MKRAGQGGNPDRRAGAPDSAAAYDRGLRILQELQHKDSKQFVQAIHALERWKLLGKCDAEDAKIAQMFASWKSSDFQRALDVLMAPRMMEDGGAADEEDTADEPTDKGARATGRRNVPLYDPAQRKRDAERAEKVRREMLATIDPALVDYKGALKPRVFEAALERMRVAMLADPQAFELGELDALLDWKDEQDLDWGEAPEMAEALFAGWPKKDIAACIEEIDLATGIELRREASWKPDAVEVEEVDDDDDEDGGVWEKGEKAKEKGWFWERWTRRFTHGANENNDTHHDS